MQKRKAFTLVELLVVIGVISLLVAMLMPALNKAREKAHAVVCMSNLRQLGLSMMMYGNDYKQAMLPAIPWDPPFPRTYTGDRSWLGLLWELKYFRNKYVTRCASDKIVTSGLIHGAYSFGPSVDGDDGKCSYAINNFGFGNQYVLPPAGPVFLGWRRSDVKFPEETYWMCDNSDTPFGGEWGAGIYHYPYPPPAGYGPIQRHSGGINMLWVDGHVTWISEQSVWYHGYYGQYFGPPGNQRWDDVP